MEINRERLIEKEFDRGTILICGIFALITSGGLFYAEIALVGWDAITNHLALNITAALFGLSGVCFVFAGAGKLLDRAMSLAFVIFAPAPAGVLTHEILHGSVSIGSILGAIIGVVVGVYGLRKLLTEKTPTSLY